MILNKLDKSAKRKVKPCIEKMIKEIAIPDHRKMSQTIGLISHNILKNINDKGAYHNLQTKKKGIPSVQVTIDIPPCMQ